MGIYVEVQCDYRTETKLNGGCWTQRSDNPQGRTVTEAKAEAKRHKWVRLSKGDCCPACLEFIS